MTFALLNISYIIDQRYIFLGKQMRKINLISVRQFSICKSPRKASKQRCFLQVIIKYYMLRGNSPKQEQQFKHLKLTAYNTSK